MAAVLSWLQYGMTLKWDSRHDSGLVFLVPVCGIADPFAELAGAVQ